MKYYIFRSGAGEGFNPSLPLKPPPILLLFYDRKARAPPAYFAVIRQSWLAKITNNHFNLLASHETKPCETLFLSIIGSHKKTKKIKCILKFKNIFEGTSRKRRSHGWREPLRVSGENPGRIFERGPEKIFLDAPFNSPEKIL